MKKPFNETRFGKIVKSTLPVAGKLIKGQIKGVPFFGNLIVDGIEIIRGKDVATGAPKTHDKLVYLIELTVAVGALTFLVYKGIIPIDRLIGFLQKFI